MNFEICKQLKKAGFPQTPSKDLGSLYYREDGRVESYLLSIPQDAVKIPMLHEIMEQCGQEFGSVRQGHVTWLATSWTGAIEIEAASAQEAAAELYLALKNT